MPTDTQPTELPATDEPARRRRSTRDLVILAVPQVILLGGMALMLVLHPNAVKSGVMSTRAVVVNAALLAIWLLLSFVVLPRLVRNVVVRSALLTLGAIAAVVVLVVPTLRDKMVVERFPEVAAAPNSAGSADSPAPGATATAPPSATTTEPVRVATGALRGIDHDASGSASLYRRADGSTVVALEDINIEPGPDYRVYLVPTAGAEAPGNGVDLDALRGNQGTQYYEVPASVTRDHGEPGADWTVLVWCRAFGVPVAAATQHVT
jgi:hypothetical protein